MVGVREAVPHEQCLVAGFSRFACPQSQSSLLALGARSPLVSIDSFASLRLWRRPTGATFGSLTPGIWVPKMTNCSTFRLQRCLAEFYRFRHPFFRFFPKLSGFCMPFLKREIPFSRSTVGIAVQRFSGYNGIRKGVAPILSSPENRIFRKESWK